jgi:hypothetical protein
MAKSIQTCPSPASGTTLIHRYELPDFVNPTRWAAWLCIPLRLAGRFTIVQVLVCSNLAIE